jgi:hypothetical protein
VRYFLLLIAAIGCLSCKREAPKDFRIQGQTFIVTAGGDSKKLGDVEVLIYEQSSIDDFQRKIRTYLEDMAHKKAAGKSKIESLQAEISLLERQGEGILASQAKTSDALNKAQTSLGSIKAQYTEAVNKLNDWYKRNYDASWYSDNGSGIPSIPAPPSADEVNRLNSEYQKARSKIDTSFSQAYSDMKKKVDFWAEELRSQEAESTGVKQQIPPKREAVETIRASFEIPTNPLKYFSQLGAPLKLTRTNADGEFEFVVTNQARYVVASYGQRKILNATEEYFWLVGVEPINVKYPKVLLKNSNMLTRDAPQCFLNLISIASE